MMISALKDKNPVIFIEHRWLHHIKDAVPENLYHSSLDKAQILRKGLDITIVTTSQSPVNTISLLKEFNFPIVKSAEKKKKKIKNIPKKEEKKEEKQKNG